MLSKKIRPIIFFVGQKPQDSFHAVRSWGFTRVNSGRDDNPGFIYFEGSLSFFKDSLNTFHSFFAYIPLISDRHEVDLASFTGSDESLLMEIDVRVIFVLWGQGLNKSFTLFIWIGINEGEFDPVFLFEGEAEVELGLVHWVVLQLGSKYMDADILSYSFKRGIRKSSYNRTVNTRQVVKLNLFLLILYRAVQASRPALRWIW